MILGSDGGIYFSYDRGLTWDFVNTIAIGQFYEVGFDMKKPYNIFGGLQDNGSWAGPSATKHSIGITNEDWYRVGGGDGFYELVQFHFHSPSEHTLDGKYAPLEAHFVHKSADGELVAVGILVEVGEHNVILEPILAALPDREGGKRHLEGLDLDLSQLRPLPKRYYQYRGSLTTPPCSEGVEWIVYAEKREVSAEQMVAIVSQLHNNYRPVQPLGERTLGLVSVAN